MKNFRTEVKSVLYFPLVNFLQEDKRMYCIVKETFCDPTFPQTCKPLKALTWDVKGEVSLGG